jgi:cytochrome c oxidase cbb3-type subunit III
MPTKVEKDEITGRETTGHEWDGIKELNTPLPKWWLYVLYVTIAWSVLWWILYPSWPGIRTHFGGLLGYNTRVALDGQMAVAAERREAFMGRLREASLDEIREDPELLTVALRGGETAFNDNCAPCHGLGGAGQGFYPSLADDAWRWGGTLDDIHDTLLFGIRTDHPSTRLSEMPAFGAMQILGRDEINDVAEYVLSLTEREEDAEAAARGQELFAAQCSACHGEIGEGVRELGAPSLIGHVWLYGSSKAEIMQQIHQPRHGVMPAWEGRLTPEVLKSLAVYVHGLGGGE